MVWLDKHAQQAGKKQRKTLNATVGNRPVRRLLSGLQLNCTRKTKKNGKGKRNVPVNNSLS